MRFSPLAVDSEDGDAVVEQEVLAAAVNKAANIIRNLDKLIPYDASDVNMGLVVWQAIRDVPESHRPHLIAKLSSGDIRRLWKAAGKRYAAPRSAISVSIGSEYYLWKDMPSSASEIVYFDGKAALPVHILGMSRFSKAFFVGNSFEGSDNGRSAEEDGQLFGRVIHPTLFGNVVYPGPMYFQANIESAVVPSTQELCDMTLSYPDPENLGLEMESIPKTTWPRPRRQLRPFDCGFVDYVRAAGPGIVVGMGYRTETKGSGAPWVPSPLFFAAAKVRTENLLLDSHEQL